MKLLSIYKRLRVLFLAFSILYISIPAYSDTGTFTENFTDAVYRDSGNTDANWNTTDNRVELDRNKRFAETTGLKNWGGGITCIEYDGSGTWLIGGEGGKINSYDGYNFINRSLEAGFNSSSFNDIQYSAGYWLLVGNDNIIKKWNGASTWTNLNSYLDNMPGNINALGYKTTSPQFWLVGGDNGTLNTYDGNTNFADVSANISSSIGSNNIKAIGFNGSYFLIIADNGKIVRYNGTSTWTDLSSALHTAIGSPATPPHLYALDWDGSNWIIAGGAGTIVTYNGSTFTDRSSGTTMNIVNSVHYNGSYWILGGLGPLGTEIRTTTNYSTYNLQTNPSYFDDANAWAIESDGSGTNLIGGRFGRFLERTGGATSPSNTDFSNYIKDFGILNVNCIEYNGSYWLIGGDTGSLNRYDGSTFTDLKEALGFSPDNLTGDDVLSLGWNGSYWLIGGTNRSLSSYNGVSFTSLDSSPTFQSAFGATDSVRAIEWKSDVTSSVWGIGGDNNSFATGNNGYVWTDRSADLVSGGWTSGVAINDIEYTGTVRQDFMIGGNSANLMRYYDDSAQGPGGGYTIINGGAYLDLSFDFDDYIGNYDIYSIEYDGGTTATPGIRFGCSSSRYALYSYPSFPFFTNLRSNLISFSGGMNAVSYNPSESKWYMGGDSGSINSDVSSAYTNEKPDLVNWAGAAINAIENNGSFWLVGGSNGKLNRYGDAYLSIGQAQSSIVAHYFAKYASVTLTASEELNGQNVDYYLSADGGSTWLQVTPGVGIWYDDYPAYAGEDLVWRAVLNTYDVLKSPYINSISIDWEEYPAYTYTITPTHTNSNTFTMTATITPTHSFTGTYTVTPSITMTSTQTVTPTISQTITETITETVTRTVTETSTITLTSTQTTTQTVTKTNTKTITQTVTPTITQTNTQTITATHTPTLTLTVTPTTTQTITQTVTKTVTQSVTPSTTPTITQTTTPSITETMTPSITQTTTQTTTKTITRTITDTVTPSITETITQTNTGTVTKTITQTVTQSVTASLTSTITPSTTPTITETVTPTVTGTITQTTTQTVTPTTTSTVTETVTKTVTPTPTPTKVTDNYEITAPASVSVGEVFYITVTAKTGPVYGDLTAENYAGTAHFTTSALIYSLPSDYTYIPLTDMGVHIFAVQLMETGIQSITATDTVNSAITGTANITVSAAVPVSFTLSAPSNVGAGDTFYVTVTAKDSYNNIVTGYTGTVGFTSSDSQAVLPGDTTFTLSDAGVIIIAVEMRTTGIQTVSANDTFTPSINGTSNGINVHAGSLSTFDVVAPAFVNADNVFNFVVTAKDAFDNDITDYTGTVSFTSTAGTWSGVADYTYQTSDLGVRIFQASISSAGTYTITATDAPASGTSNDIIVSDTATAYTNPLLLTSYLNAANTYAYTYIIIDNNDYTFGPNMYLEYDVFVPDFSSNFYCSTEFQNGSFGTMRDYVPYIIDQNSIRVHSSMDISDYARGQWYHRKFDISTLDGEDYSNAFLSQDTGNIGNNGAPSNKLGTFNAIFDNIVFTNSSGTVIKTVFSNNTTMPYLNREHTDDSDGASWSGGTLRPSNNEIWVLDDFAAVAEPASGVIADGSDTSRITVTVKAPSGAGVPYALVHFTSPRPEDIVSPVTTTYNSYAITNASGEAYCDLASTKSGAANINVYMGHMTRIVTVNFVEQGAMSVKISPDLLTTQTGVSGTLSISLVDSNDNPVSDARGITLTSSSATMEFSADNGQNWSSSLLVSGSAVTSVLVRDSVANVATVTADGDGIIPANDGTATVAVNNGTADHMEVTPLSSTAKAGDSQTIYIQAKDSLDNNAHSTSMIGVSATAGSQIQFSKDLAVWSDYITTNLISGAATLYYRGVSNIAGVTITAQDISSSMSDGLGYATIISNVPYDLDGWANLYSVNVGGHVSITAKVVDAYGNPIANQEVTFIAHAQSGTSWVTSTAQYTDANGEVWVDFAASNNQGWNYCVINSPGLQGITLAITGTNGDATSLYLIPQPMSQGADKIGLLHINGWTGSLNAPMPSGYEDVIISTDGVPNDVLFSNDAGNTWSSSLTFRMNDSGGATVNVKAHTTGSYTMRAETVNTAGTEPADGTSQLNISEGLFVRVSPTTSTSAEAGSYVTITAQIVDQNGNTRNFADVSMEFYTNYGAIFPPQTVTDANGQATAGLTMSIISNLAHIVTVVMTSPDDVSQSAQIISDPKTTFSVTAPSGAYGGVPIYVTVRARDAFGATVTDYDGMVYFSSSDPSFVAPANYQFVAGDNGVALIELTLLTNGIQTVSVTDVGDPAVTGTSNNILVEDAPTPTVTRTVTQTITETFTNTQTITQTMTQTVTQTVSPTITQTTTQTVTQSVTESTTATITQTSTQTVTQSVTPTMTQTVTQSVTPSVTQSATQTVTQSLTQTVTQTVTQSVTQSVTATLTDTITPTSTSTVTGTMTQSVTMTTTQTSTQTVTQSYTITETHSVTATITETYPYSPTVTPTMTLTHTSSYTYTVTATVTETMTMTITRTSTQTVTETVTSTVTPSVTMTITQSNTMTVTQTITSSLTLTVTLTHTQTITETLTASITQTVTPTITYTATITQTETFTSTYTITPTYTVSRTWTITETFTNTPTVTATPTPIQEYLVFPNPYDRELAVNGTLKMLLPAVCDVEIFDVAGFMVYTIKGVTGRIEWDGTNKAGESVAPGVYLYIIRTPDEMIKGKLFVIK